MKKSTQHVAKLAGAFQTRNTTTTSNTNNKYNVEYHNPTDSHLPLPYHAQNSVPTSILFCNTKNKICSYSIAISIIYITILPWTQLTIFGWRRSHAENWEWRLRAESDGSAFSLRICSKNPSLSAPILPENGALLFSAAPPPLRASRSGVDRDRVGIANRRRTHCVSFVIVVNPLSVILVWLKNTNWNRLRRMHAPRFPLSFHARSCCYFCYKFLTITVYV